MAPLARPEAGGRIALHQLNVVVTVLHRVDDVLRLDVLVEVDEVEALGAEDRIRVIDELGGRIGDSVRARFGRASLDARGGGSPGMAAVADYRRLRPHVRGGAGQRDAGRQIRGAMHVDSRVEYDFSAGVAGEVERRREADARENEVAVDPLGVFRRLALTGDARYRHRRYVLAAFAVDQRRARNDAHATGAHGLCRGAVGRGVEVDDGGDGDSRVEQVERRLVAEAVRRRDDGARAGLDAVKPHQPLRGVGEHDAGTVVIAEDQRLIEGAGGDDRLLAADLVEAVGAHGR